MGSMLRGCALAAVSGADTDSGSMPSTGAATRLFRISLTLMPLFGWLTLMTEDEEEDFSASVPDDSDSRLSSDLFTSEDSVDMSPARLWSESEPLRRAAACSSPMPESVRGMEASAWRLSEGPRWSLMTSSA